jgi:magnesium transporter
MIRVRSLDLLEREVRHQLQLQDDNKLIRILATHHPADIADIIDRLTPPHQLRVFRVLQQEVAAEVLGETDLATTRQLLAGLPSETVGALLDRLPMDDVAEILGEDVPDQQQALLAAMQPNDADQVRRLLNYPPRSAGRLMTERFASLPLEISAGEAISVIRRLAADAETINVLFVLNQAGQLVGSVTLANLITALPGTPITSLMTTNTPTIAPETDQEEVGRLVAQYDLLAIPVIDADQRLLGIVTVDDVIDVLVEEGTEDLLRFGAVYEGATDETYFATPIMRVVRRRVGWLLLLFLTGTLTVNVLGWFEATLDEVVALSFFIPLLIGTGGNTGAQTVSTMVRSLALGEVRLRDAGRVVLRELISGLTLGCLLAVAAFALARLLGNDIPLALVVAISVVAICTWANTIGALVPLMAQRFGLDPALVSAPLITTLVDATGLAIYLLIASALLDL